MTEKTTGLDEYMRLRDGDPPNERRSEKALEEWMTEQSRLEEMTPEERERHECELKEKRKRRMDDDGYGLDDSCPSQAKKADGEDSEEEL